MFSITDRRSKKRQVRAEGIVETAIALVEKGGLESLTIHRLAAELDLAVSAIYRYWPSMDALHAELQRRIVRDYHLALATVLDGVEEPLVGLIGAATHYRGYFLERRGRFAVIAMSMSDPRRLLSDEQREQVLGEVARVLERIRALFAAAKRELGPGDAAERTMIYWATLQGVMQLAKLEPFPLGTLSHEALLARSLRTMLLGFGADPRKLTAAQRRAEKL